MPRVNSSSRADLASSSRGPRRVLICAFPWRLLFLPRSRSRSCIPLWRNGSPRASLHPPRCRRSPGPRPRRQECLARRAHRLGQDARRLPDGDRRAGPRRHERAPLPDETSRRLRLAAARRCRTTSKRTCSRRSPASAKSSAELGLPDVEIRTAVRTGDTPANERTARDREAAASVRDHAGVALHPAHVGGRTTHALQRARRDRGRDPRPRRGQTRQPPRALARAAGGAHRATAAAHRPVRDAAADRATWRASSWAGPTAWSPDCTIVDTGHVRARDLAIELPSSPLGAVMSGEVGRGVRPHRGAREEHKTTLIFVNTRRLCERAREEPGRAPGRGRGGRAPRHRSRANTASKAEQRLKAGELAAPGRDRVARARHRHRRRWTWCARSGSPRSIATLLAAGRALRSPRFGDCRWGGCSRSTRDELVRVRRAAPTPCARGQPRSRSASAEAAARHPRAADRGRGGGRGRGTRTRCTSSCARAAPYRSPRAPSASTRSWSS